MAGDSRSGVYASVREIRKHLPHRYPFLLIDKVTAVAAGRSLVAVKNVTRGDGYGEADNRCFPSEFILEIFGQAAILLFFAEGTKSVEAFNTLLVGVDTFNIYDRAMEGDCIEVEVSFEKMISNAAIIAGRATIDGKTVADARLSAAFVKKSGSGDTVEEHDERGKTRETGTARV